MMRWLASALFPLLIGSALASGPSDIERIDAFLSSPDRNGSAHRWRVLLMAECMGAEAEDVKGAFERMREIGEMPHYSDAWCVANDLAPKRYREGGERS